MASIPSVWIAVCDLSARVCRCQVAALPRCTACACLLAHAALAFARARREAARCAQKHGRWHNDRFRSSSVCGRRWRREKKFSEHDHRRGLNVFEPLSCIVLKSFSVWLHNRPQQFFGVTTHLNRVNCLKRTTGNLCLFMKTIQRGWVEPTDSKKRGSVEDSRLRRLGHQGGSSFAPKPTAVQIPFNCPTRKTQLHEKLTFGSIMSTRQSAEGVEQCKKGGGQRPRTTR
jgi:hypothetical protein